MDFKINPRTVYSATSPISDSQNRRLEKLRESSEELEAIFLNEMYKAMRKAMPEDGLFPKTDAEKMFQEMQDMEMVRTISRTKSVGLQMAPLVTRKP